MPAAPKGPTPPGWLTLTDAVAHTGIPPMTLRRRIDAWLNNDTSRINTGYAIRGAHIFGGRVVDQIDAERVRLQRTQALDKSITGPQWQRMIIESAPGTDAPDAPPWWPTAVNTLRAGRRRRNSAFM